MTVRALLQVADEMMAARSECYAIGVQIPRTLARLWSERIRAIASSLAEQAVEWTGQDRDIDAWLKRHGCEEIPLSDARQMFDDARSAHMIPGAMPPPADEKPAKGEGPEGVRTWLCKCGDWNHPNETCAICGMSLPQPSDPADAVRDVIWRIDNEAAQFVDAEGMKYLKYVRDLLATSPTPQRHDNAETDRATVVETRCGCHPETCCCGDYTLRIDGKYAACGSKDRMQTIADAVNAHGTGAAVEAVAVRKATSGILKAIAELLHGGQTDAQFEQDVIQRPYVLDRVVAIRQHIDEIWSALSKRDDGASVDDAFDAANAAGFIAACDYGVPNADLVEAIVRAALSTQPLCTCPVSVEYPARFHSPTCALRAALHPEQAKDRAAG